MALLLLGVASSLLRRVPVRIGPARVVRSASIVLFEPVLISIRVSHACNQPMTSVVNGWLDAWRR